MSTTLVLTGDSISESWTGGTNESDSWASAAADGGSITAKLGAPTTQSAETVSFLSDGTAQTIHMGTWVTDIGASAALTIANTSSFCLNYLHGYETAGQMNAIPWFKISIVTESGGVLTYNRTILPWTECKNEGTAHEFGQAIGSPDPMGGYASNGSVNVIQVSSADTIAIGERLAIEIGITTVGRNGETCAIEYGALWNDEDDATLLTTDFGAGKFGSALLCPFTPVEAYQDEWGAHSEIIIPWVAGTDIIAWADIGTDWTVAKWETTGATRKVIRGDGGNITAQYWIFQDDDYLYIATNNQIDGCIQNSDHQEIFLCPTQDWKNEVETDNKDWIFRRSITSGTSATRDPNFPVLNTKSTDYNEYVLQGKTDETFPRQWELPSYSSGTKTHTFASNSYTWIEGTDFRIGGPGATSAAPHPSSSSGAYSEFKISKAKLNNWDGFEQMGIIINLQCDVQGNGHMMFPSGLGQQVDKADWFFCGGLYELGDQATASGATTVETTDLRPTMAQHGHAQAVEGQNLFNLTTNATAESTEAIVTNENAFEASISATAESTEAAISNENFFEVITNSTVESTEAFISNISVFEAVSNATAESTEAAILNENFFEITANSSAESTEAVISNENTYQVTSNTTVDSTEAVISNENVYQVTSNTTVESTEAVISNENFFEVTANSTAESTEFNLLNENLFQTTANSTVESSEALLTTTGEALFALIANATVESAEASIDLVSGERFFNVVSNATAESSEAFISNENAFETTANSTVQSTEAVISNENVFQAIINAVAESTEAFISNENAFEASSNATASSTEAVISNENVFQAIINSTVESNEAFISNINAFETTTNSTVNSTEAVILNENFFGVAINSTVESTEVYVVRDHVFAVTANAIVDSLDVNILNEAFFNPSAPGRVNSDEVLISNENVFQAIANATVESTEADLDIPGSSLFAVFCLSTVESSDVHIDAGVLRNADGSPGGIVQNTDGSPGGIIKRYTGSIWE